LSGCAARNPFCRACIDLRRSAADEIERLRAVKAADEIERLRFVLEAFRKDGRTMDRGMDSARPAWSIFPRQEV
jgi:Xaa-Pro aminopeptidase